MKSALPLLIPVLTLALFVGGCEKTAPPPSDAVLFEAIKNNVSAFEKKDVDAVMATIHPKAPSYDSTREVVSEMFKAIDLKYTLSDLRVVTASPEEAQVSFVQKTEKAGGTAQFPGNIVQGIHTLRPDNGTWKIYRTLQTKVTGLDGKPLGVPETSEPAPEPSPSPAPAVEPAPKPDVPAEKPAP